MQKKPNPWGLYDMHGNVAEFCIDQYAPDWYSKFAGKGPVSWHEIINWPDAKAENPYPRVIRGGGADSTPEQCRSAARVQSSKEMNARDPQIPKSPFWLTEGFS